MIVSALSPELPRVSNCGALVAPTNSGPKLILACERLRGNPVGRLPFSCVLLSIGEVGVWVIDAGSVSIVRFLLNRLPGSDGLGTGCRNRAICSRAGNNGSRA